MKAKLYIVLFFILTLLLALPSCNEGKSELPTNDTESNITDITTEKADEASDSTEINDNKENGDTDNTSDNKTAEYVFNGKYSKMPKVKAYTDRLPDELKIYRSMLSEAEKRAYDLMLPYALSYTDFTIDLNDLAKNGFTVDDMFEGGTAINKDYPETWIYWSAQYKDFGAPVRQPDGSYTTDFASFGSQFWPLHFNDKYNKATTVQHINKMMEKADKIIAEMPSGLKTKEKYKWIADYICNITVYPTNTEDFETFYADGPLLYGKGICQGYAYAYQLLCQKAGLWCILCSGGIHAWNVVKLDDGLTYYMDLTWQDATSVDGYYYFMTYKRCLDTGHTLYEGEWIADGKN